MAVRILYFASVRDAMGREAEAIDLPAGVATVAGLVDWLATRDAAGAAAFADRTRLRAAIDQRVAPLDAPVADGQEVALFPPVTGG